MGKPTLPFVRGPYNYDRDLVSVETGYESLEPSLTQQSFAEDADINTIVKRFGVTGALPQGVKMPTYGDFTEVRDFQTAMNAMLEAEGSFMQMPAEVRERFDNDPQKFVEFCSEPKNRDEAEKLGLVEKLPEIVPTLVKVVADEPVKA